MKSRARRRKGPSDPASIALQAAIRRAEERAAAKNPAQWGIAADNVVSLETARDIALRKDPNRRGRIAHAHRADAFDSLHRAKGLNDVQHQASRRYMGDWMARAGIKTHGEEDPGVPIDGGRSDPSAGITMAMIGAGVRIDRAHALIGRGDAILLQGLVEPLIVQGELLEWREAVERLTGETGRHAQGARVRAACENLRWAYETMDEERRRRKGLPAAEDAG